MFDGDLRRAFHRYGNEDVASVLGGSEDGLTGGQFRKRCLHQHERKQGSVRTDDDEAVHAVAPGVPGRARQPFAKISGPLGTHGPSRGNVQRAR